MTHPGIPWKVPWKVIANLSKFLYYAHMENIIRTKLTAALNPLLLEIVDESHKHAGHAGARAMGPQVGNTHFNIKIVSRVFAPMSRLERHRFVHEILKTELDGQIHALSLTLRSPKEIP